VGTVADGCPSSQRVTRRMMRVDGNVCSVAAMVSPLVDSGRERLSR